MSAPPPARPLAGFDVQQAAQTLADCTPLLFALGETARQQIVLLLTQFDELNVNQLAERLPLSRPAISHHLKILRQAGLVTVRQCGVQNLYALRIAPGLAQVQRLIGQLQALG